MRRIILSDLKRLLGKKSVGVFFLISLFYLLLRVLVWTYLMEEPFLAVKYLLNSIVPISVILGVVMFNAIYGDDFRSMSYITAIGRGISRTKVVFAKLIDIIILSIILYGILCLISTLLLPKDCLQNHTMAMVWYGTFIISVYKTIGYMALASMVLFITNNIPIGTIVLVLLYFAAPSSGMLFGINEALYKLHLERIHFEGIAENAFTDILYGSYGAAIFKILIGLIVYLGGVLIVTNVIFGKRELDF